MIKVFGTAFDPLDIPERLDIKVAYLDWLRNKSTSEGDFSDPYDFIETEMKERYPNKRAKEVKWIGKFPVDSWLRPKPAISDINHLSQEEFTRFLDGDGCHECSNRLVEYLTRNIGTSMPVMIGVDHSLTGGVLKYLSKRIGDYNILIFDSHCDLIDLETRKRYFGCYINNLNNAFSRGDIYECGSFLYHLLKENIIKPENLWIVGAQDVDHFKENAETLYSERILPWIRKGLHILSKKDFLCYGIPDEIKGQTYVSFDMDLGSLASVYAARFLNYKGLDVEQMFGLINVLSERIRTKKIDLIGLDIMEMDIHLLGENIGGNQDYSPKIAYRILDTMVYDAFA
ncbi:MAG: arginase family protein [Deltaproteobacteria bacterium]